MFVLEHKQNIIFYASITCLEFLAFRIACKSILLGNKSTTHPNQFVFHTLNLANLYPCAKSNQKLFKAEFFFSRPREAFIKNCSRRLDFFGSEQSVFFQDRKKKLFNHSIKKKVDADKTTVGVLLSSTHLDCGHRGTLSLRIIFQTGIR